jgi:amidase
MWLALIGALVLALAARAPAAPEGRSVTPATVAGIDVDQATIPELQRAMRAGRLSSTRLTDFYIDRIAYLNPWLKAVTTVNRDAMAQARRSDRRRRRHDLRGPMDGIPVLLKDNIDTADRQPTTAGSLALLAARPQDATLVARLRRSGAVLLGKANLSEWANFRDYASISGWSAVGGQTNNPYVLDRNPCGSSSGSAVAVAADLTQVAFGTETWGSIMCPSGANGVVGIKPSIGVVSRAGVVPITPEQDTAGPMARNVTDAAIALAAVQGVDDRDPATADAAGQLPRDYRRTLKRDALRGKRIGLWRNAIGPEVNRVLDETDASLRAAGATVIDTPLDDTVLFDPTFRAMLVEFKPAINAYLAQTPGEHPADLAGLIDFNRRYASLEMPLFGQGIFEDAQLTDINDPGYRADRQFATSTARQVIDSTLAAADLDAIVGPTNGPAWLTTGVTTTCTDSGDASTFAAVGGYTNVAVPAGFACGALPIDVSFFAGRFSEATLLALAYAFEQATQARRAPALLPTLPTSTSTADAPATQRNTSGVSAHAR